MKNVFLILLCFIALTGCYNVENKNMSNNKPSKIPELVIYCENGLVAPIMEISASFEIKYKCKVKIHNDCARNLINVMNYSNDVDLFIPDSYYSMLWLKQIDPSIILDSLYIGDNKLVFIVKKGNPLNFDGSFSSILSENFPVVLSNPETGSLGYETMKLLKDNDLYDELINSVIYLAVDSRGLARSVVNNESEIAIDWLSSYYNNMADKIDTINIKVNYKNPQVYAAILKNTKHKGLSYSFLALLSTSESTEIFAKHGIIKSRKTIS